MDLERRLQHYLVAEPGRAVAEAPGVQELLRTVRARLVQGHNLSDLQAPGFRRDMAAAARKLIEQESEGAYRHLLLTHADKERLFERLMRSMFGYGPLEELIHDPNVTEIMVNSPERIFVERGRSIELARDARGEPVRFVDEQELRHVIDKIVAPINKKVDDADPIVDARLPDGSRVNAVLRPVSLGGTALTIRRFPASPYTLEQLVEMGALADEAATLLTALVRARYNLVVSGSTASGKTTVLNSLSQTIPPLERLVTVEDAAELRLAKAENLVQLETRPPNVEGRGEITMRQLVKAALRMRPDRIIGGEVRGGEALDMLQAMNTGHDGSLTTVHANTAQDVVSRLETMVLMAGLELPIPAIRQQIVSAVDLVLHLTRLMDGTRRVVQLAQVTGLRDGQVEMEEILALDPAQGRLVPTGRPLHRWRKLAAARPTLPASLQHLLAGGDR